MDYNIEHDSLNPLNEDDFRRASNMLEEEEDKQMNESMLYSSKFLEGDIIQTIVSLSFINS
jgi:hypothetical protein